MKKKCSKCPIGILIDFGHGCFMCDSCFHEIKPIIPTFNYKNYKNTTTKLNKNKGGKTKMENEKQDYVTHKPQKDDVFICMSAFPYKSEPVDRICYKDTDKECIKSITNYGLYVKRDLESETIFLKITKGMFDNLRDMDELKDKKIIFYTYEHKTYGTLLSVKELK